MTQAFEIAGVGLASQQQALDVIANNVANINTPAFKRSDVRFSEIIAQRIDAASPRASLTAEPSLAGVAARSILTLNTQGDIDRTGRTLDVAIDGPGFIELMGARGETLLWRGGGLSIDESGALSAGGGLLLRAMINVPADATDLLIASDGVVSARLNGDTEAKALGQIMLVRVDDAASIERMDGGLYRLVDERAVAETAPGADGAGRLLQGAIERSNVDMNDEMIRLLIVQRAFAANAQVVQAADQFMGLANGLRR
jgi:flagellar basal-body rod protein FlgG